MIFNQATTPNRFVFDGGGLAGQSIVTDLGVYDVAIGQQMKWGGGRFDFAWDTTRWESTNIFSTFNPSFGANMTLQYTQPLLRGFRTDSRRTQLVVSRINRDISDIGLEETVVNTLANVSLAYWDLVYARAAVGVRRQALALTEQLVQDNRVRVEVGTMAPIDVVQAQSGAAARRQLLALAVETQRTSELVLKELIVGGMSDELWDARSTRRTSRGSRVRRSSCRRRFAGRSVGAPMSRARVGNSTSTKRPSTISATAPCRRSIWSGATN